MSTLTMTKPSAAEVTSTATKSKRIQSIDLLRGVVMIIMALDHVRDYFHADAFLYNPEDLSRTNVLLFFTRFITHYCAPVFVFLAGTSAYLSGAKKTKKELSFFLLTRGIWLVLVELFILGLFRTFNPTFPYFNLQVIWAIGICMIALSALIYLNLRSILVIGILLITAHNLLDSVHVTGNNLPAFFWSFLHDVNHFTLGRFTFYVHYPVLPWLGIMLTGYYFGQLYISGYDPVKRRNILLYLGFGAIVLFIILRSGNFYGDAAYWSVQKNTVFSLLSFINVTKYPPSLLYTLITLGPAFVFLAFAEKPLNALSAKITIFGRVPMFYYLAHILMIHILATIGAIITGYKLSDMILSTSVMSSPGLKGYGFNLLTVYAVWIGLVLFLYPFCKWFDRYKRANNSKQWWLSYL
ncbi:MAG: DUF1624 domain-containing protein [Sphingobacteriales bacterium]